MDPEYKKKLTSLGLHFGINLDQIKQTQKSGVATSKLEGTTSQNSLGEFFYRDQYFTKEYKHGAYNFFEINEELTIIDGTDIDRTVHIKDCIFIDTETTGLSVSGGTFAFMIGVGFFEQDQFTLRQYFLKEQVHEDAMLLDLLNFIEPFSTIISYNGVSFDLPIIKSRFRYHRIPANIEKKDHIDLLKFARMYFRFQFDDRSLKSIESKVLKFERSEEEIPGYLAPIIYQEYLKTKATDQINGVFYHNAMDIVSLGALIGVINQISLYNESLHDKYETVNFSIAKQYEKNKIFEKALNTYQSTAEQHNLPDPIRTYCLLAIAKIYKRQSKFDQAIDYWKHALLQENYEANIELAKVYEHKIKNIDTALKYCKKALFILEKDIKSIKNKTLIDECIHRINRLEQKAK